MVAPMTPSDDKRRYDYRADPILGGVLAHWLALRADRQMPRRADIIPRHITRLLPHLQMIDVVPNGSDGGNRFRHRLIGTKITSVTGCDYTGKYFDEVLSGVRLRNALDVLRWIVSHQRPVFLRMHFRTLADTDLVVNRIYLPLSDNDADVNVILCAANFQSSVSEAGLWAGAECDFSCVWKEEILLPGVSPLPTLAGAGGPLFRERRQKSAAI